MLLDTRRRELSGHSSLAWEFDSKGTIGSPLASQRLFGACALHAPVSNFCSCGVISGPASHGGRSSSALETTSLLGPPDRPGAGKDAPLSTQSPLHALSTERWAGRGNSPRHAHNKLHTTGFASRENVLQRHLRSRFETRYKRYDSGVQRRHFTFHLLRFLAVTFPLPTAEQRDTN
ncbi:hypothetical protein FA95DRAFT_691017 [Auriscalpium vulgare]|uniref:Uncharacterized protein n=1 Tax=Auriscalpium vulgare TaxID=40419 RepID=A0ACB8RBP4_9AGAM|nr:hypothetical protein FA95DRAFT_691017 [Auriscalpium vulgare]